jgi:hypothetical protein
LSDVLAVAIVGRQENQPFQLALATLKTRFFRLALAISKARPVPANLGSV